MSRIMMRLPALVIMLAVVTGCASLRPAKSRLDMIERSSSCETPAKVLLVVLPGLYDRPEDIVENGFADAVARRGINADVIVPDLHFGYYRARTVVDRLHQDIIAPAMARSYEQIWLTGISLGGFGALLYSQRTQQPVAGMLLIAPYLGEKPVHDEIRGAGGLAQWMPREVVVDDHERQLWQWLRDWGQQSGQQPDIWIGYGDDDAFAPANRLLAATLPQRQTMPVEGGHDWKPWLQIWKDFLDRKSFPVCVTRNDSAASGIEDPY